MSKNKVIYLHKMADSGLPFYIGRGSEARAKSRNRAKNWTDVVDKHGLLVEILERGLSEEESKLREIEYIKIYREFHPTTMINVSDGGDAGPSKGYKLLYTEDGRYFLLKGRKDLLLLGFNYFDVRAVLVNRQKTCASSKIIEDGKLVRFKVRQFPISESLNEIDEFIIENGLVPFEMEEGSLEEFKKCVMLNVPYHIGEYKNTNIMVYPSEWWGRVAWGEGGYELGTFTSEILEPCINFGFNRINIMFPDERFITTWIADNVSVMSDVCIKFIGVENNKFVLETKIFGVGKL